MPQTDTASTIQSTTTITTNSPLFNKVIMLLTASDLFSWGIYYVLSSLAGIYLAGRLNENVIGMVGAGTAIYYVVRGSSQLPLGWLIDKLRKDVDEVILLSTGIALMGLSFYLYPFVDRAGSYYLLQFMFGLGSAIDLICWRKLFAQNLDHHREGKQYAIYETIMSLFAAVLSIIAGMIANIDSAHFDLVMFGLGGIMTIGAIVPLFIFRVPERTSK